MRFQFIVTAFALVSPLVSALGINCRGSSQCGGCGVSNSFLSDQVSGIPDDTWFPNGQNIACYSCTGITGYGSLCVFAQNTDGVYASTVKEGLKQISDHGCQSCGSDPINPGNNVATGAITVNFVG